MAERLVRRKIGVGELDSVEYRRKELETRKKDIRLLMRAHRAWDNMHEFREERARNMRFVYGDQWGDLITVHGSHGEKKTMTMREYLSQEGQIPQQTNQIKTQVNTIVGVLVKEQNEPVCNAVDRDEQQYGELVTTGLKANSEKNRMGTIFRLCSKDLIIGGLGVCHESYGFREGERRREDSWTRYIDPNYVIMETTLRDPRFWDMTMIGCWYRMPFTMLAAEFVKKKGDYETLKSIYGDASNHYNEGDLEELTDKKDLRYLEFMASNSTTECCVAEIWTLETKERVRLHDYNEGSLEVVDADDREMLEQVKNINRQRKQLAKAAGWSEEEAPIIETEYFIDTFWYCRMLAPDGTILWEEESPYPGRNHPFTIMATPFIDGRIAGYIVDAIDHQIAINRAVVLQDWIVRNQIKGFTMIPQQLVPDDMENEEFVQNSLNIGNFFFYDADKARGLKPEVFHAGAINFDAGNFITQLKSLMDSSTAINGAIQGRTPYSGTSAALYAQQTQNASTPIADLLADVRSFMQDADYKKMKNIAAFYDAERWQSIAGSMAGAFDNANLKLNDVGDIEFDLIITESTSTPVYRALANDMLMQLFQQQAISLEELLENGDFPFADRILQSRQARQAEAQAAQNGEMQPPQGQMPGA